MWTMYWPGDVTLKCGALGAFEMDILDVVGTGGMEGLVCRMMRSSECLRPFGACLWS